MTKIKDPLIAETLLRKQEAKVADFELRNKAAKFKLTAAAWLKSQK